MFLQNKDMRKLYISLLLQLSLGSFLFYVVTKIMVWLGFSTKALG